MHERVSGPVKGYHIAAYASETTEPGGGYLGYFKLCRDTPESYWEADCLLKRCCPEPLPSVEDAMEMAMELALRQIGNLPALGDLPAANEGRNLYREVGARARLAELNARLAGEFGNGKACWT